MEGGLWWSSELRGSDWDGSSFQRLAGGSGPLRRQQNYPLIIHPVRFSASLLKKGLKKLRWTGKIFGFYNNILLIRILTKINYKVEYILWKFNIGTSRTSKNNCIFFDIWSNLNNFITGLSLKKKQQWNVACSSSLSFKKTSDEFVRQVYQGLFHTQDVVFWIAVVVRTWNLLKGKKRKLFYFW